MKKLLSIFFLLSFGTLSAQNINFKDTNGLAKLLCSRTWVQYTLKSDSAFSKKIHDSLKLYPDRTFYNVSCPDIYKSDSERYSLSEIDRGFWNFGEKRKIKVKETTIDIIMVDILCMDGSGYLNCALVDGHRIKGTKAGKLFGNINGPFLLPFLHKGGIIWDKRWIWQPKR